MNGPEILNSETRSARAKMKKNKEYDKIIIQMLAALNDLSNDTIRKILKEIYNNSEIPEDLSRSNFIENPKKLNVNKYKLHQKIRLIE